MSLRFSMSAPCPPTEEQRAVVVAERRVVGVGGYGVGAGLLLRERNVVVDAELLFVEVLLLGYALLEKVEMVVRHSEVDVRLPIGTGIQCPFHEMLLERCADAVIVAVEEATTP